MHKLLMQMYKSQTLNLPPRVLRQVIEAGTFGVWAKRQVNSTLMISNILHRPYPSTIVFRWITI